MFGTIATWNWIGALGMLLGTLYAYWGYRQDGRHRTYYAVLAGITGIAAVAYALMALGIGEVTVRGRRTFIIRYVDWLFTTPLIVLYLGLLAKPGKRIIRTMEAADVVVIVGGIAGTLLTGVVRFVPFVIGTVAYLYLVRILRYDLPEAADFPDHRAESIVRKLRNLTVVLWTLYPVVWFLGTSGVGLLEMGMEVVVFVYLDFVSKVGFVIVAVNGRAAIDRIETWGVAEDSIDGPAGSAAD